MPNSYSNVDYKSTHFEYKELTKIHGQPDIDSLLRIFRQLKRNAQKVQTILGGGQLGYLALVLSTASYDSITNSLPFARPVLLGTFTPSTNRVSAAELAYERALHDEKVRVYNECQAVEQALRNQLTDAIPDEYLDALRNVDSDMINDSIPDIITFLQTNYCQLTEQELSDREDRLKNSVFNPEDHVDLMFNKIKAFADLCVMTGNDKTDGQLVSIGYLIFNRTKAYMDSLKLWNAKPKVDRTFNNFKLHLRTEFHALRQVNALTIRDSNINLLQDMTNHQTTLSTALGEQLQASMQHNFEQALSLLRNEAGNEENVPPPDISPSINHTPTEDMFKMMKEMQSKMETLTAELAIAKRGNQNTTPTNTAGGPNINPITGAPFKRYCHSCGCCPHWGSNCTKKKRGHKDPASFPKCLGGSNANCMPNR